MESVLDPSRLSMCAVAAGCISHWTYFIHGEHHTNAPNLVQLAIILPTLFFLGIQHYTKSTWFQAATITGRVVFSFYTSLWTSIIVYRIFFHPLRKFSGPFMFKVSKLWHVYKLAPGSDNYLQLDKLHKQYGDFVRTGPGEISVFDPAAVSIILGAGSKCTKAPWYDANVPHISLQTLRDKAAHDKRRRIWDRGFGAKALRQYEDRILGYSKSLQLRMSEFAGKTVNVAEWFHYYSFDVMGDVAFGKSFDMLETGKPHFALDLLREGMKPFGVLTPVPWVFCILTKVPGLSAGFNTFVAWTTEQVRERKKMIMDVPDVMSWLIDDAEKASPPQRQAEEKLLESDSRLIIVAGSDTTAATLTYAFYYLAKDASQVEKLRAELGPLQDSAGEYNVKDLQGAQHLNGVINEALRLHPPVPSGVLRVTPAEGITVGKTYIPGGITVVSPPYTVSRLESCFENASDFIPERWYSRPEMVKNSSAFVPFSIGPYSCIGKQLALMELRTVIALLVSQFDVKFAPGEDGAPLIKDSKDYFTISLCDLHLVFTPRITG